MIYPHEILSIVRLRSGRVGVVFDRHAFSDPGEWGVVLADAIRDIAKGCAPVGALRHEDPLTKPQEVAIRRLLDLLTSELGPYLS